MSTEPRAIPIGWTGQSFLVDEEDYQLLKGYSFELTPSGYPSFTAGRRPEGAKRHMGVHRWVMRRAGHDITYDPVNRELDHINGNRLDARKINLRFCTHQQNQRNRRRQSNNTSGYKGVGFIASGRYQAKLTMDGRTFNLGCFDSARDAAIAYDLGAKEHYAEFASPNITDATDEEARAVWEQVLEARSRAMLRWIAAKQATLTPVPYCGWQVIVGYNLTERLSQNVVVGRGTTPHEALEAAMRAEQEGERHED